ncbi:MAG: hypothetical protein ACTSXT_02050 [Candidatus Helarchaeota archaeon]
MRKSIKWVIIVSSIIFILFMTWFIPIIFDNLGPTPRFVEEDWTELDKIYAIGKFHSTLGHGYPDDNSQYSDKHYFIPLFNWGNSSNKIKVFSPFEGRIVNIFWENHRFSDGTIQGHQIWIESVLHPSIIVKLFHINIEPTNLKIFQYVHAGQLLGYMDAREWCSTDIAVTRGFKTISWFEILSNSLFEKYKERGIISRELMIKTEQEAQESFAMGYSFSLSDPGDYVLLKNTTFPQIIDNNFINISKIGAISYMPNILYDTEDNYFNENVSWSVMFKLNPNKVNPNGYSTEFKAPFTARIERVDSPSFKNPVIILRYINSTSTNYTINDFELDLEIYNISAIPNITNGEIIKSGELLGYVGKYFNIECVAWGNTQYIPVFGLMNNAVWEKWPSQNLNNRSQMALNYDEYRAKVNQYGYSTYHFSESPIWWINITT